HLLTLRPPPPTSPLSLHDALPISVLLHDGVDGRLIAILNASAITEIRTAAVSGLASTLLARRNARRVAILGSGVQGRSHAVAMRSEEHTSELQSRFDLVCRLLLEK